LTFGCQAGTAGNCSTVYLRAGHRIPIIFITAHADDEQERRAMKRGNLIPLQPFSQESLLQAVRSASQVELIDLAYDIDCCRENVNPAK
jgi:FixJ family two-component response regulator